MAASEQLQFSVRGNTRAKCFQRAFEIAVDYFKCPPDDITVIPTTAGVQTWTTGSGDTMASVYEVDFACYIKEAEDE